MFNEFELCEQVDGDVVVQDDEENLEIYEDSGGYDDEPNPGCVKEQNMMEMIHAQTADPE